MNSNIDSRTVVGHPVGQEGLGPSAGHRLAAANRVDGKLGPIESARELTGEQIDEIVRGLSTEQEKIFEEQKDVDFSLTYLDRARLRGSAFTQKGHTALALRMIPSDIPTFDELGLPPVAEWLARLPRGLVLLTGPTGSGKSTTLASIIDRINQTRSVHILTIEDPVEYVHKHGLSAVTQRDVGTDTPSFERALRSALREDPDVLLVGEMRDLESIQLALTMAETGHLVFSTLHTNDSSQAIDRIIDVFPSWRQEQIRVQLGSSLGAVLAQRLVPRTDGGMVAAFEILIANHPVATSSGRARPTSYPTSSPPTRLRACARSSPAWRISWPRTSSSTRRPWRSARTPRNLPAF